MCSICSIPSAAAIGGTHWYISAEEVLHTCSFLTSELIRRKRIGQPHCRFPCQCSCWQYGAAFSHLQGSVWDHVWGGYDSVFTLINVAAFFVLSMNYSSNRNIVHRFIELVSRNTLGIFFIHEIFIHLTHRQVNMMPPAQNIIGNIIYTAVILLVSLFSAMVIKSIPVLKKLLV